MKRKWLAGCLACLLLLCGCKTAEPITSVDNDAKTSTQAAVVTTTTTVSATTITTVSQSTKTTRPKNYTYDTDGPMKHMTMGFSNFEQYTTRVKTFTDMQAIFSYGNNPTAQDVKAKEEDLSLLLKEKYVLIPNIPQQYRYGSVVFSTYGYTSARMAHIEDESLEAVFNLVMFHGKDPELELGERTKRYSFTNERGKEITRYDQSGKMPVYVWKEEDTTIRIFLEANNIENQEDHLAKYEQFLKTLTFEKVEIK